MNVKLVAWNNMSQGSFANLIRISRGVDEDANRLVVADREMDMRTICNCYKRKHLSVFEFLDYSFWLDIPIYVARQLMRYRHCSYIERSLRYCEPMDTIDPVDDIIFGDTYRELLKAYQGGRDNGLKKEEARKLLPMCTRTQLYMKIDGRELFHIFDERLASSAQKETRHCVQMMKAAVKEIHPWLIEVYEGEHK